MELPRGHDLYNAIHLRLSENYPERDVTIHSKGIMSLLTQSDLVRRKGEDELDAVMKKNNRPQRKVNKIVKYTSFSTKDDYDSDYEDTDTESSDESDIEASGDDAHRREESTCEYDVAKDNDDDSDYEPLDRGEHDEVDLVHNLPSDTKTSNDEQLELGHWNML